MWGVGWMAPPPDPLWISPSVPSVVAAHSVSSDVTAQLLLAPMRPPDQTPAEAAAAASTALSAQEAAATEAQAAMQTTPWLAPWKMLDE